MSDPNIRVEPIPESEHNQTFSIIEQFPEYKFIPVSVVRPAKKPALIIVGSLLFLQALFFYFIQHVRNAVSVRFEDIAQGQCQLISPYPFLFLLIIGIVLLIIGIRGRRKALCSLKKYADYLSGKEGVGRQKKMRIFVKNRKFGVLKKGLYTVFVPAEYDKLSWRDKNILDAEKDGRHFIIDVYGNELN